MMAKDFGSKYINQIKDVFKRVLLYCRGIRCLTREVLDFNKSKKNKETNSFFNINLYIIFFLDHYFVTYIHINDAPLLLSLSSTHTQSEVDKDENADEELLILQHI